MRYLRIILCLLCCNIVAALSASNVLRVDTLRYPAGKTVTLPVVLENQSDIAGVQFDISVPYELKTDDTGQVAVGLSRARATNHEVVVRDGGTSWNSIVKPSGYESLLYHNYRIVVYSSDNSLLVDNQGELLTIQFDLAADLPNTTILPIVLSKVVMGGQTQQNVASDPVSGAVVIEEIPRPDLTVANVSANKSTAGPGDTIDVSWLVRNIGDLPTAAGWAEQITLVSLSGTTRKALSTTYFDGTLGNGSEVSRQATIVLPDLLGIDGIAHIEVAVQPYENAGEHASAQDNNSASGQNISITKRLTLELSRQRVAEGSNQRIQFKLSRSGRWNSAYSFAVSSEPADGRLPLPERVNIPAGQSGAVFYVNVDNNDVLDDDSLVSITVSGDGYEPATAQMVITDDEQPDLTLSASQSVLNEGDTFQLTVTASRPAPEGSAVEVSLASEDTKRFQFPATVTIPAGQTTATVDVLCLDNDVPNLEQANKFTASARGYNKGETIVILKDNDMPVLTLTLTPTQVSEAAGPTAVAAVLTRTGKVDNKISIRISDDSEGGLYYGSKSLEMPAGTETIYFNLGPVDNTLKEGDRTYNITAAIWLSSCNCASAGEQAGNVTAQLTVLDNDGAALSVKSSASTVKEGGTTLLTVSRNTTEGAEGGLPALTVNLTSDYDEGLDYPHQVTIPAGEQSVQVEVQSKKNDVTGDSRTVVFTVTVDGYSSGTCFVLISDQTLPDARIADITAEPQEAIVGSAATIYIKVVNEGNAPLPEQTAVKLYRRGTSEAIATMRTQTAIDVDNSLTLTRRIALPDEVGTHRYYAVVNEDRTVIELQYTNNSSADLPVTATSPFTATVETDKAVYTQNEPVTITGQISVVGGSAATTQTAGTQAQVYFVNGGIRTTEDVTTDADGRFSLTWTPYALQAGHFAIGVCYPGDPTKEEMTGIDVYGLRRATNEYIKCDVPVGDTYRSTIALQNPGSLPLSGVKAELLEGPATLNMQFSVPETIGGNKTADLSYTLVDSEPTVGNQWEKVIVRVTTAEGVTLDITIYYYARAKKGNLEVASHQLTTTMLKDEGRDISFIVTNTGRGNTGRITLALPDWMSVLTGPTMPGLEQNDTATVVLRLTPTQNMQLNVPVTGRIGINCENGNGTYINFNVTPVSDKTGTLVVDVCDEYTYYTDEKPHVKGAEIVLRNAVTGALVAQGQSGDDGTWAIEVPEGYYQLNVAADKHDSYRNNILVDPGTTTLKTVNLSYQAVSISWDVVETEVEDEYQIVTTVQYETRVPMPVVETIVPDRIAADSLGVGESLVFYAVLTNKGLITAKETSFTIGDEYKGGYHWERLVPCEGIDLAPQQSLVVPVKVTKMGSEEAAGARKVMKAESGSGGCSNITITLYTWDCGEDNKMHTNPHTITFEACPASGGGGSSGWGGGYGAGSPNGGGGNGYYDTTSGGDNVQIDDDCDQCLNNLAGKIRDCLIGFVPVVGCAYGVTTGCLPLIFDDRKLSDLENCIDGIVGCIPGAGTIWGVHVCKKNIERAINDCLGLGGSRRKAPVRIVPSYVIEYQERLIVSLKALKSLIDYMKEFFGEEAWTDISGTELRVLMQRVKETTRAEREFVYEDFIDVKPQDISDTQLRKFLERMNNTTDYKANGTAHDNMMHGTILDDCAAQFYAADEEAQQLGYVSLQDMWLTANEELITRMSEKDGQGVCATISLQINQTMTLTRQAFRGTLTVFNGNDDTPMQDMKLRLNVTNLATGQVVTSHEMEMHTESLKEFEGELDMESGWTLAAQKTGVATILFIPTKYAAPEVDTEYSFGGTLSYIDPFTGLEVTRDLYPVTLTVKPSPELDLTYFMQRDIYGDDAMTDGVVEPMVPAEFAVIINNKGYGDATNVRMVTEQPKIIENKKGLFINFEFVSSQLNGQEKTLALGQSIPTEFGTIGAHSQAYAQWWMQSTLLGHFVDYNIEATHVTSYGNEDLSLLDEVTIHELIHGFTPAAASEPGGSAAGRAFLVNDVLDADDLPDQVYFTDATQDDVHVTTGATVTKQSATEYLLTIRPSYSGWNYGNLLDPTVGKQTLVSITRQSDGQVIPVDNIWQTDRTLLDGQMWRYENRLHFVADIPATVLSGSGAETFLLTFSPKPSVELAVTSIEGVPATGTLQMEQLTEVTVNFNKDIDPATFTAEDITLNCQGVAQDASLITIERITDSAFRLCLNEVTLQNGYYVLTIQAAGITDREGFNGAAGRQATWVQFVDGKVNLAVKAQPAEGGTVTPASGQFDYDHPVTLTATPNTGYDFVRWMETAGTSSAASGYSASTGTYTTGGTTADGATVSTDLAFTYTPSGDATLTALFQARNYSVAIDYDAKGGTVGGPGTGLYPYGTELTLTATPADGYTFDGWQLNGTAVAPSVTDGFAADTLRLTVAGTTTVKAVFTLRPNITLTGHVKDANGGAPITGATITLTSGDLTYTATTDQLGRYTLDIADRTLTYAVLCKADGYMWSPSEDIWFTDGSHVKDFVLMPGATVVLPDNGVCTFSSTEALDLSDTGIEAYYVTSYANGSFILSETTRAAAGEGIILKGAVGERKDIPVLHTATRAAAPANPGNLLVGTAYAPYTVGDDQVYLLNEDQQEAHFYLADKGYVVPMGKAFVLYTIATGEENVSIIWSEATLIEMVQKALNDKDSHYNLGGQPMHKNAKGVHINMGKKTVKR